MKRTHTYASFAGAGLLSCTLIALAQTPPGDPNPNQPPRPREPAPPAGQQPPPRQQPPIARPAEGAQAGYMETPKYAQRLDTTLSQNTIQVCADNDFKGEQTTLEGVMKMHQGGTLNAFPADFDNAATSLRWNLEPGVLVVFFEDDTGKGQQLALWGKGQIPDLAKCDFNETASRWCWYNVGGGASPRSAGDIELPHGAQALDGSLAQGSILLFDDQNFVGEQEKVAGMNGIKAGEWHAFTNEKENAASSLRWNLPEGVVVIFAAEDGGNDNLVIFGEGQNADLGQCDFDNKASRWSWAYIGSRTKEPSSNKP